MSSKDSFYYQIKYFASHGFCVIAPDFPGFGASAALTGPWSVGDYADWLKKFIAASAAVRPHIIAHSFGARVALKLLSREDIADRLVITGGAGIVKPRTAAYRRKVKLYKAVKTFAPRFAESHFGSAEYRALPPVMRGSYKLIVNEDLRSCASRINNACLLVYGAEDAVTPPQEEGRIFSRLIPASRLCIVPGGHFCFSQYPEVFNRTVLSFITED